jgi:predicted membrane-bound spermidine synthase
MSTLVLLPPVFLIGGTMPLLAKYFLRDSAKLGSSFSKIYYLNTLGACAGAVLTGFVLVRIFGVIGSLMIAVGGNLLVALIIALSKRGTGVTGSATGERPPYSYMLVFLFLTGFISLGYEMLWVRILSTYGLSTSQAFALILAGFLLGFSVGAWIVARKVDQRKDLESWFSAVSIVTAFSGRGRGGDEPDDAWYGPCVHRVFHPGGIHGDSVPARCAHLCARHRPDWRQGRQHVFFEHSRLRAG